MNLNIDQMANVSVSLFGFQLPLKTWMRIQSIALGIAGVLIILMAFLDKTKAALWIGIISALLVIAVSIANFLM